MKYTGRACITQINYAIGNRERVIDRNGATEWMPGVAEAPVITLMLTGLKDETAESINRKLQDLVGGVRGDGRVTIIIERRDE